MHTTIIRLDPKKPDKKKIGSAAQILRKGGLVAFPTETVYGLGANALDEIAVKNIFVVKGRPSDNPLIVHIADKKEVYKLAREVPKKAVKLMDKFWPGPLTIVLKKRDIIPDVVSGNLDTVAIRMPSNKIALELIKQAGVPVAAPSANLSGKPSPTTADHVVDDLNRKIPVIICGGNAKIGLESTVIDLSTKIPMLLRPGRITAEQLVDELGKIRMSSIVYCKKKKLKVFRSPGMKYRHYSPNAKVILVYGSREKVVPKINEIYRRYKTQGKKVAIVGFDDYVSDLTFVCKDVDELGKVLFDKFREFDDEKVDIIIVEGVKEEGFGLALMNRAKKAASIHIKV